MIVAIVNGYEITDFEYQNELKNLLEELNTDIIDHSVKLKAINHLIDAYLLLESAQKSNVQITEDELENKLLDIMLNYPSEEKFKEMLSQNNINYQILKKKINNELLIKKFVKVRFKTTNKISDEKLKEIYEENKESFLIQEKVRASHILVEGNTPESLKKIVEIKNRINSKEQFMQEAAKCSDCPSKCNYGDLGYFERGKMVKEFEDVAFSLEIGEISQPVRTRFGYHLIMVTDKKRSKIAPFESVKDALANRLAQIEAELNLLQFIKEQREKAEIKIYEERL